MGASALAGGAPGRELNRRDRIEELEVEIRELRRIVRALTGEEIAEQLAVRYGLTTPQASLAAMLMRRFPSRLSMSTMRDLYDRRAGGIDVVTSNTIDAHLSRGGARLRTFGAPPFYHAPQVGYRVLTDGAARWLAPRLNFTGIEGFSGLRAYAGAKAA